MVAERRVQKEPWDVPLASLRDPDIVPFAGPAPAEPTELHPGCYWRLRPGEPLDEVTELPRHHHDQPVVFFGGPQHRFLFDTPHGRRIVAVAQHADGVAPELVGRQMVVVYAMHRATGHINDPDRFLVVLNGAGSELVRLDFSSSWELGTDSLHRMCDLAGLSFARETYQTEAELLAARPRWTPAHVELEVEHPAEADVRDFGMALWIGTFLALALGSGSGMAFVFGTPVKYVVFGAAFAGLAAATVISTWSNIWWKRRRLQRQPSPAAQRAG